MLEKLADIPFYTEGPAMDAAGNFYCTTLSGGQILKRRKNGKWTAWAKAVCPNGQIILPDGDHLVCDSKLGVVLRFDAKGRFLKEETPKILNVSEIPNQSGLRGVEVFVPNDLIVDKAGNLYFTDSIRHTGKLCLLGKNGEQAILAENLDYPNGLVLSADETVLFVAESYQNRILKMDLAAPNMVSSVSVFANLPSHPPNSGKYNLPDGLALRSDGVMAVAHYGMQAVQILDKNGVLLQTIDTTLPLTSNVIFLDDQTLLVTGGYGEPSPGAVFRISY